MSLSNVKHILLSFECGGYWWWRCHARRMKQKGILSKISFLTNEVQFIKVSKLLRFRHNGQHERMQTSILVLDVKFKLTCQTKIRLKMSGEHLHTWKDQISSVYKKNETSSYSYSNVSLSNFLIQFFYHKKKKKHSYLMCLFYFVMRK